jgi:hypothetical protein
MDFKEKFEDFDKTQKRGKKIIDDFIDRLTFGWYRLFKNNKKDLIKYLTPKWFEFLGWLLALASLFYATQKTKSISIFLIFTLSIYLFFNFIGYLSDDILLIFGKNIKNIFYFVIFYLITGILICLIYQGLIDFITKMGF